MSYQHIPSHAPGGAEPPAPLRVRAWVPLVCGLWGLLGGPSLAILLQQAGWVPYTATAFWLSIVTGVLIFALGSWVAILVAIRRAHEADGTWRPAGGR